MTDFAIQEVRNDYELFQFAFLNYVVDIRNTDSGFLFWFKYNFINFILALSTLNNIDMNTHYE